VLFCDLVGSTEIAALLDPEEWRKLIASYHRAATEAITQFGGYVAQYLGDGVMAYFGWPEAHNNSAESAARAGLAIVEKIAKLDRQYTHGRLSVRVGIHFGAAVIGRVSKGSRRIRRYVQHRRTRANGSSSQQRADNCRY
jgi:class 3 adenylate cyclase